MSDKPAMTPERWIELMQAWGFSENLMTCNKLIAAYSQKGRHYHTTEHISACLRHMDACKHELDSPREVEISLWFHDAIYRPFSGSNEKDSADWAASFMSECGASNDHIARVHALIMVTQHNAPTQTRDEAALVDIDLSILGAKPSVYEIFEQGVRKEYRLVPWFIYRKKRAAILRSFLQRPRIYISGIFSDTVEYQARENLSNAISRL